MVEVEAGSRSPVPAPSSCVDRSASGMEGGQGLLGHHSKAIYCWAHLCLTLSLSLPQILSRWRTLRVIETKSPVNQNTHNQSWPEG